MAILPESEAWQILDAHCPKVLPVGWVVASTTPDGAAYVNRREGISVIVSVQRELDERRWLHVSVARANRMPTYDDLAFVKRTWIGADRKAVMVFAPASEHVNIHPFALHLWHCVDGDPLPDFTHGGSTL